MKRKILFLVAIACSLFSLHAANNVVVPSVTVPQGGSGVISVELNNDKEYTAFSMKLTLPDGVSLVSVSKGSRMVESHSLSANPATGMITCLSTANELFTGTSGELFTITVSADDELTIGALLDATLTEVNFSTTSAEESLANVNFGITISENRVLLDETSTVAPVASGEPVDVKVRRTITAGNWNTICLPFAMTEAQCKAAFGNDVQLADFTGYDVTENGDDIVGITVNFSDATAIEANHPYIIKVSSPVSEFTVDGVVIDPVEKPQVSFGYTTGSGKKEVYHPSDFNGTYVADFDFYGDAESYPLFLSGNNFYYATESTRHMKAFRAYFDFDDYLSEAEPEESARIAIRIDDAPTGIVSVRKSEKSDNVYYDLSGRRVEKPGKGFYIVNGKKIFK
jgi:hypothetical protein